jgi:hypothetical protein
MSPPKTPVSQEQPGVFDFPILLAFNSIVNFTSLHKGFEPAAYRMLHITSPFGFREEGCSLTPLQRCHSAAVNDLQGHFKFLKWSATEQNHTKT